MTRFNVKTLLQLAGLLWLLAGCGTQTAVAPAPTAALSTPTAVATSAPIAPEPPDSGWAALRPGLERRTINLLDNTGAVENKLYLLRLEPESFDFRVAYRPGEAQLLSAWQAETGALLVVNGGFFTEEYLATGLTVADGQSYGATYGDFAGMFAVNNAGTTVRWLGERPYNPKEPLNHALQSFPLLVRANGTLGYAEEDSQTARRTVVAEDDDGRILFIVAPWGGFTLRQLSDWLLASDLNLTTALNLDGGTSTGLLLSEPEEGFPAYTAVPAIIAIHPRTNNSQFAIHN